MIGNPEGAQTNSSELLDDDAFGSPVDKNKTVGSSGLESNSAKSTSQDKSAPPPIVVPVNSTSTPTTSSDKAARNPTVLVALDESSWSRAGLRWILRTVIKPTDTRIMVATTIRLTPPNVHSHDNHAAWRTKTALAQEKRIKKLVISLLNELGKSPRSMSSPTTSPRSPSESPAVPHDGDISVSEKSMTASQLVKRTSSPREPLQIDVDVEIFPSDFLPRIMQLESSLKPRKILVVLHPEMQAWVSRYVLHGNPYDYIKSRCDSLCEVTELTQTLVEKLEDSDVWSVAMM